jgi:hypothetical protein
MMSLKGWEDKSASTAPFPYAFDPLVAGNGLSQETVQSSQE